MEGNDPNLLLTLCTCVCINILYIIYIGFNINRISRSEQTTSHHKTTFHHPAECASYIDMNCDGMIMIMDMADQFKTTKKKIKRQ